MRLQGTVLKAHLLVEAALDNVVSLIFFHPDHIYRGRFGIIYKAAIARAYCLRKDKLDTWNAILAFNAVRNEIAHNLSGKSRQRKLDQLRRLIGADAADDPGKAKALKEASDAHLVRYACALCIGFIGAFEHDVQALRNLIDAMDMSISAGR